jgi:hypothetical protein
MPQPSVPSVDLARWAREAWDNGPNTDKRTPWTHYFNDFLARRVAPGVTAFGCGPGHNGQYLVDHCWSAPWTCMRDYRGLDLIAEFEWHGTRSAIEEDLIKLADVRAQARLFVGNLWGADWKSVAQCIADDAATMLAKHRFAREDRIVLAIGPKGQTREQQEGLLIWEVTASGATPLRGTTDEGASA